MNMKKTALAAAVALTMGVAGAANADTVTSISITGGYFGMGAASSLTGCAGSAFSNHQCVTAGTVNPINTVDGAYEGPTLSQFNFFNAPVTTWTAASASGAQTGNAQPIAGSTSGSTITLDMGSFYANWNGTNFLQAPSVITGLLNPEVTGTFTSTGPNAGTFNIAWSSYIKGGSFDGQTGYWDLAGTATTSPVPAPAAIWLFGGGMIGLMGLMRRSRKARAEGSLSA